MTRMGNYTIAVICTILLNAGKPAPSAPFVLKANNYKHYIDLFNTNDQELYAQYINNAESWKFLSANIPLFDCPDKEIEQTYYFRWWTYRKHIRKTPGGFVILEFLPDVTWAGKYNTISCAAGHHIYEGRWLHDQEYINDYERFWFTADASLRTYSCWIADAVYKQALTTNDFHLAVSLLPNFISNFESWEKERLGKNGLFWQEDGQDGMEVSICGAGEENNAGYRATINSYMYADAMAIAKVAAVAGRKDIETRFVNQAFNIKKNIQQKLWDQQAEFFKVLSRDTTRQLCDTRELHGYTPWYFSLPDERYSAAWKFLMDPKYFYAPYGPTTAEQKSHGFSISYTGHECQWNGPSWPFATSLTLTAMANLLNDYHQQYVGRKEYLSLLEAYTKSHSITTDSGEQIPWIDENVNPFTGDWISRTRLKTYDQGTWSAEKGGVERGKDYNHSTYCDLIITGLVGLRPQSGDTFIVNPLLPDNKWEYFCLDNVLYHGKIITIIYDKKGTHYNKGKGLFVFVDGSKAASSSSLSKLIVRIK